MTSYAPGKDLFVLALCAFFAGIRAQSGEWAMCAVMLVLGALMYWLVLDGFNKQVRLQVDQQLKQLAKQLHFLADHMRAIASIASKGEKP